MIKNSLIITLLCLLSFSSKSQTIEQAKDFGNRTHIALAKVQKEMYRTGKSDFTADLKKALKYQTIAVKMYSSSDAKNTVAYSYKARAIALELLQTLSPRSVEALTFNEEEKGYCKPADYSNLKLDLIDDTNLKKIENLNVLDVTKFRELELSLK